MTITWLGSPDKCYYCDSKSSSRTGIVYRCEWHTVVGDIVSKAQSGDVLIIKNGEYWDFKADVLRQFIDEKLADARKALGL